MRFVAPLFLLAFGLIPACSSKQDAPTRTVNCSGSISKPVGGDSGSSCAGICLAAKNPCTDFDLGDGGLVESCPAGFGFAPNRYSCANGASCCLSLGDAGPSPKDGAAADAAGDAPLDSPAD